VLVICIINKSHFSDEEENRRTQRLRSQPDVAIISGLQKTFHHRTYQIGSILAAWASKNLREKSAGHPVDADTDRRSVLRVVTPMIALVLPCLDPM
jgi:hypothetical protein